jgi:hypothetical protein
MLQEEIKSGWAQAGQVTHLGDTVGALNKVRMSLRKWSMAKFGSATKELKQI